jgi:hypothetical protein
MVLPLLLLVLAKESGGITLVGALKCASKMSLEALLLFTCENTASGADAFPQIIRINASYWGKIRHRRVCRGGATETSSVVDGGGELQVSGVFAGLSIDGANGFVKKITWAASSRD